MIKYSTDEIINGPPRPHKVALTAINGPVFWEMFDWLDTHVGRRYGPWNWQWHGQFWGFDFETEEDKVKFILRWA